jgi:tryptophan-rich sensory protein
VSSATEVVVAFVLLALGSTSARLATTSDSATTAGILTSAHSRQAVKSATGFFFTPIVLHHHKLSLAALALSATLICTLFFLFSVQHSPPAPHTAPAALHRV